MLRVVFGASLVALVLAGCATNREAGVEQTPAYATGYGDGCATAYKRQDPFSRAVQRDEEQFAKDLRYQAGWQDGYQSCGGVQKVNDPAAESQSRWYSGGPNR